VVLEVVSKRDLRQFLATVIKNSFVYIFVFLLFKHCKAYNKTLPIWWLLPAYLQINPQLQNLYLRFYSLLFSNQFIMFENNTLPSCANTPKKGVIGDIK
jgi:hypothetical protein